MAEKKQALYLAYPERNMEVFIEDVCGEQTVFTGPAVRSAAIMRLLKERGYEVRGFRHRRLDPYQKSGLYRWDPIDMASLPDANTAMAENAYGPDVALARAYEHDYGRGR
jgi:hypothetical protein